MAVLAWGADQYLVFVARPAWRFILSAKMIGGSRSFGSPQDMQRSFGKNDDPHLDWVAQSSKNRCG
jgi:hypothetical protein